LQLQLYTGTDPGPQLIAAIPFAITGVASLKIENLRHPPCPDLYSKIVKSTARKLKNSDRPLAQSPIEDPLLSATFRRLNAELMARQFCRELI
jgi:hypothetical protein